MKTYRALIPIYIRAKSAEQAEQLIESVLDEGINDPHDGLRNKGFSYDDFSVESSE